MSEKFEIVETFVNIPGLSEDFNLKQALDEFYIRYSKLDDQRMEERDKARQETKKFLLGLLEVADALDRIIEKQSHQNDADGERLFKSVESTRRLLLQKLAKMGAQRMDLMGKILDPNLGDIEGFEDNATCEPETVLSEIVCGYFWNDLVLRRAKVIVSA